MYPLVSVIIPVYNVKPYLSESLNSVINQTYHNLEIIIVDDGSTDGSGIICDEYANKDSRIHVIHQENKGLSGARNTGLDIMQGDLVAFLDPDDDYLPDMIDTLTKQLMQSKSDIAVCGYYVCNTIKHMRASEYERRFQLQTGVKSGKEALSLLIDGIIDVTAWNKLYVRHIFDTIRFPAGYVYEDQITMPLILEKCNSVVLCKQSLVLHRIRPKSIITTKNERNMLDLINAKMKIETFVDNNTPAVFSIEQKRKAHDSTLRNIMGVYLELLSAKTISNETRAVLCKEIEIRGKQIQSYSWKIRMYYKLLNSNIYLCMLIKKFCVFFRRVTVQTSCFCRGLTLHE